jgi:hypothetical protein
MLSKEPFQFQFWVWVVLIAENPIMIEKCRTEMKALFLYFNWYLRVMLDSVSCSLTFILLTNQYTSILIYLADIYWNCLRLNVVVNHNSTNNSSVFP